MGRTWLAKTRMRAPRVLIDELTLNSICPAAVEASLTFSFTVDRCGALPWEWTGPLLSSHLPPGLDAYALD